MPDDGKAYAEAGVDISLMNRLVRSAKRSLERATRPEVLGEIGAFGGLFDGTRLFREMKRPVLVASTDSAGTKIKIAAMAGSHEGIGHDIVNHCLNDIAVMGAEPLFFLDYFGTDRLREPVYVSVLKGMGAACRRAGVALLGGETAEMPGVYGDGEYDIVGTVVGVVERKKILSGEAIRPGDSLVGLASSGPHTNGYSLLRKIFFDDLDMKVDERLPRSRQSLGQALLKPHRNYSVVLRSLLPTFNNGTRSSARRGNAILGAAHITGGGFVDNIPRILPEDCGAEVETASWTKSPLFRFLETESGVAADELYEVFNMGIGLVLIVKSCIARDVCAFCEARKQRARIIGKIVAGDKRVELIA